MSSKNSDVESTESQDVDEFNPQQKLSIHVVDDPDRATKEDAKRVVETLEREMSEEYGGSTTRPARGAWYDENGTRHTDSQIIVETVGDIDQKHAVEWSEMVKSELNEMAVMVEIETVQVSFI